MTKYQSSELIRKLKVDRVPLRPGEMDMYSPQRLRGRIFRPVDGRHIALRGSCLERVGG